MPRYRKRSLVYGLAGVLVLGLVAAIGFHFMTRISYVVPPAPDYADGSSWLCRPDRADTCAAPVSATVFEADGSTHIETYKPIPTAPIDCFYVYPTVTKERNAYSPIKLGAEEVSAARRQLALFSSVCRPFAPLYRQVTLKGLPDLFANRNGVTIDVPYADVLAAWKAYLAKDNGGRGVVLIGHSQGSRLLARLIKEEIDTRPIAAQLVSAILPGTRVDVPPGKVLGGSYRQTPLCEAATQTGCVIAYSTYAADASKPVRTRFGVTQTPGMLYACVNPAALDGSKFLVADLSLDGDLKEKYGTDFAEMRGVIASACKVDGAFSRLAIDPQFTNPADASAKALFDRFGKSSLTAGMHGLDVNVALGTLVDLVRKQSAAYLRR